MKRTRVYIATTEGPAEVQRITAEDPGVHSVVCLDGKAMAMPISAAYNNFVSQPTGVIEAAWGHGAFRMDLSREIAGGLSWQLGAFAAHALLAADRLAGREEASAQAVWITGEVDRDLRVGRVEGLQDKLRQSGRLFTELEAAGIPLTILMPRANHAELDAEWLAEESLGGEGRRILGVDTASDVLAVLRLPRPALAQSGRSVALPPPPRWKRLATSGVAAGLALAVGAGAAWTHLNRDMPAIPPAIAEAAPAITLTAIETRSPAGQSCAAVHFKGAAAQVSESALAGGRWEPSRAEGLCDLRYRIVNTGDRNLSVWAFAARRDGDAATVRTRAFAKERRLSPGGRLEIDGRPPRGLAGPLGQGLVIAAVAEPAEALRRDLNDHADGFGQPISPRAWDTFRQSISQRDGLSVVAAEHEIRP